TGCRSSQITASAGSTLVDSEKVCATSSAALSVCSLLAVACARRLALRLLSAPPNQNAAGASTAAARAANTQRGVLVRSGWRAAGRGARLRAHACGCRRRAHFDQVTVVDQAGQRGQALEVTDVALREHLAQAPGPVKETQQRQLVRAHPDPRRCRALAQAIEA